MPQKSRFLLLTRGFLSSPWVTRRQRLSPAMHVQCQYNIFFNLLKVALISHLIYQSSGPEHRCDFHIMSSVFKSTYVMWEPHFQKWFTILWACLLDYKSRRNVSFLCPLVCLGPGPRVQHTSGSTLTYFLVSMGRKPGCTAWKDSGSRNCSFLWLFSSLNEVWVSSVEVYASVFIGATFSAGCWD